MNWVINNWAVFIGLLAVACELIWAFFRFFRKPSDKQIENVKEWLKLAVVEAEKQLGNNTGQLKLRVVYDRAVTKFPWMGTMVSFETFSAWVDEALEWMEVQLISNPTVREILGKGK